MALFVFWGFFLRMITRLLSASSYLCSNTTAKVWFPVILPYTQVQTYSVFVFVDIISDVVGNGSKPWTNNKIPSYPGIPDSITHCVDTTLLDTWGEYKWPVFNLFVSSKDELETTFEVFTWYTYVSTLFLL